MSDQRLREAERRWKETHEPEAELALVQERLRTGRVRPEQLVLAAELGSATGQRISGRTRTVATPIEVLSIWGQSLGARCGTEAALRVGLAELHRLVARAAPRVLAGPDGEHWQRIALGWCDRVEEAVLGTRPTPDELAAWSREIERAMHLSPAILSLAFDLHGAVAKGTAPTRLWLRGASIYRELLPPPEELLATLAAEVVPWALGHADPLRRRLDELRIAGPCAEDWEAMEGDERARRCARCAHDVFDLSALDVVAARRLVAERTGRMCVRFYRREDGRVLTRDCPDWLASQPERQLTQGIVA